MPLTYRIAKRAQTDLTDIMDYTFERWGLQQVALYQRDMVARMEALCDYPHLGRARDDLAAGVRSLLSGQHSLFYRIDPNEIVILAVMHQSADLSDVSWDTLT